MARATALLLLALLAGAAALARAAPEKEQLPAAAELEELNEEQVERAQGGTEAALVAEEEAEAAAVAPVPRDLVAPAPAPEEATARRLLGVQESPLGRRALLGTLTVNISQGDVWKYQSKTTVEADIQETENGTKKLNVGVARGQAFAANGLECFKEDCADPVAEVRTQVTPGSAVSGPQATAQAVARGDKISATRTKTASIDYARNGDDVALATGFADSYSVQGEGRAAGSFATVQANAVAGEDVAQWTGAGSATAEPFGDYGHKRASVVVRGLAIIDALSGGYGKRRGAN